MKAEIRFLLVAFAVAGSMQASESLVVHEWGTFTTVSGSDGRLLSGLEREEHALPNFVHSHAGFSPANKGWDRPVTNVTVKMETPVIYFYAPKPLRARVKVGFRGGSISQWYPERAGGERLPAPPSESGVGSAFPPVDFDRGYVGAAEWTVDVLAPDTLEKITAPKEWETPQWPRARVPAANQVRSPTGEVEGFIFYRGIGHFALPLEIRMNANNTVMLKNRGPDRLPFVLVYQKSDPLALGNAWWTGSLAGKSEQAVRRSAGADDTTMDLKSFAQALVKAGLSPAEAQAMLATWRESYFERAGLRVFWIVPRSLVEEVLPLTLTPRPARLERVLVGRSEVLAPSFEVQLRQDFAADGGKAWLGDRYYLAYRERARQLGVVLRPTAP